MTPGFRLQDTGGAELSVGWTRPRACLAKADFVAFWRCIVGGPKGIQDFGEGAPRRHAGAKNRGLVRLSRGQIARNQPMKAVTGAS